MDLNETSCEGQSYLGSKCFTRFIALSRGLRPLTTLARIKCFLPINHERMDRSWWYLHILLILMGRWSWPKVKVTRSKVKVKYAILWKYVFWLHFINQWLHIDDAHTQDKYCWDVEVDQRSRSKGQRSRSNIQVCKKTYLAIYHEPMIGYGWYLHIWLISMRC